MITVAQFFEKYPAVNECWKTPDDRIHFNKVDAELHCRIYDLTGKPVLQTRDGEQKSKKTS